MVRSNSGVPLGSFTTTAPGSYRRAALALALIGTTLVLAPSALAQPAAPALTPAQHAEWEKKRDLGKAEKQRERWAKAREAYLGAWQIKKDWNLAANLGLVELKLGKHRDAAEHLDYAVREAPPGLAAEAPDEWNKLRELQRKTLAKVGALAITVKPAGAEVLVNGLPVGKAPLSGPVFVEPGQAAVEARAEGFALGNASVRAFAGTPVAVKLVLVPVGKKGDLPPPAPPVVQPRPYKPFIIGGAAVAGLGVILGGVFAGVSNGKSSASHELQGHKPPNKVFECDNGPECKAIFDSLQGQRQTFAGLSISSFIAAGVGAGVLTYGLVTYLRGASVQPVVDKDRVGLHLSGAW